MCAIPRLSGTRMAAIDIRRVHNLTVADAKIAVDQLAESISSRFGIGCKWQGDVMCFSRPGVDGSIEVRANEVRVQAKLGLLMRALQPMIEQEISRQMDDRLA